MDPPGIVTADAVYTLDEAQRRLRLGKQAWRTARLASLPVRQVGRRRYVLGRDVLEWLSAQPVDRLDRAPNSTTSR
jgi:hypothetical protein